MNIDEMINYFEEHKSQWNGKHPGVLEDKAHVAGDIIELLQEWKEITE